MVRMMIVGQISSSEEAKEVEAIAKILVVGNRVRALVLKTKGAMWKMSEETKKNDIKNKKSVPDVIDIIWVNI